MNGFGGIIAFVVAMAVAHLMKSIIYWGKNGFRRPGEAFWRGMMSGGMPSGHTADMAALTTYLGLWQGFDSALFALAVGVTILMAYDASHVRYAVGEMGKELNKVTGKKKRVYEGHTVPQVVVGAVVGILIGWAVFTLTR